MPETLTAVDVRRWAVLTRSALAARRAEIDALNVFPVPDGDTGTNLYLTVEAAVDDVLEGHRDRGLDEPSLLDDCTAARRAVLLAARGNSGVIFSQFVRGVCDVVVEQGLETIDPARLAELLARGASAARSCVQHPKEGTILTVADRAADAATGAAERGASLAEVGDAAVDAAREALAATPGQLPALAHAGVVDAGGAGLVLVLETLQRVAGGHAPRRTDELSPAGARPSPRTEWRTTPEATDGTASDGTASGTGADQGVDTAECATDGPAYEVMYLLAEATEESVAELTTRLDGLGDSLLVVGGPDLWNVHVHVDDPGAAVEAGLAAGRPQRIRISHFASQTAGQDAGKGAGRAPGRAPAGGHSAAVGVVACAAGPGIAAVMEGAGAVVVASGPGGRASAGQLLAAMRTSGGESVVVLPGDPDTMLAAEVAVEAAAGEGLDAHVLPSRSTVQSIAALAVLDPMAPLRQNLLAMTSAAVSTRHGAVTVASKQALTWAGVCEPGDVLGIVGGDVLFLESDLLAGARGVLGRLLSGGGELVTLVVGGDADPQLVTDVRDAVLHERPDVEVTVIDGGQPVYPLLIGVE